MELRTFLEIDDGAVFFEPEALKQCSDSGGCCSCGKCCVVPSAVVPDQEDPVKNAFSGAMRPCPSLKLKDGKFLCGQHDVKETEPRLNVCRSWVGNAQTSEGMSNFEYLNAQMFESLLLNVRWPKVMEVQIRVIEKMAKFGLILSRYDISGLSLIWSGEGAELISVLTCAFNMNPMPRSFIEAFEFRGIAFRTTLDMNMIYDHVCVAVPQEHHEYLRSVLIH